MKGFICIIIFLKLIIIIKKLFLIKNVKILLTKYYQKDKK